MKEKYKVRITQNAQNDIAEILSYIKNKLANPKAANSLYIEITQQIELLSDFPKSAPLVNDNLLSSCGIRALLIKNYIAFYQEDSKEKTIDILHFIYAKRDYINILKLEF